MGYGNILDDLTLHVPIVKARLLVSHISAETDRNLKGNKINGE